MPLVVDLDGTLIHTDLLHETASRLILRNPIYLFCMLYWILKGGICCLKENLASRTSVAVDLLPYNNHLLEWLRVEKKSRPIILATASNIMLAKNVANYLQLFDQIYASDNLINLKSKFKKQTLVKNYGEHGFDYVGNALVDESVWNSARRAYTVNPKVIGKLDEQIGIISIESDVVKSRILSFLKLMRPHQWLKNLLIFVPLFASHQYYDGFSVWHSILAFMIFGITASSAYILNDIVDLENDRAHHTKKDRPLAAGNISLIVAWTTFPCMLVTAFLLAATFLPKDFLYVQLIYVGVTFLYSFLLKKIAIIDVLALAMLYTLRIIAGTEAINAPTSIWLLSFSLFFFLSLALIKRFSELKSKSLNLTAGRPIKGRGYFPEDLEFISTMGIANGYISVLILALYVQDLKIINLYATPQLLWGVCPLMLYWISRIWLLTHRGKMSEDPVYFAAKDRVSWIIFSLLGVIFIAASYEF